MLILSLNFSIHFPQFHDIFWIFLTSNILSVHLWIHDPKCFFVQDWHSYYFWWMIIIVEIFEHNKIIFKHLPSFLEWNLIIIVISSQRLIYLYIFHRVKDISNPAKKFKVKMNAKQLYMTGCVLLFKDTNIVVVEGGPKQQKKFQRLMLHRIRWSEDVPKAGKGDTSEDPQNNVNRCILVWQVSAFNKYPYPF